MRLQASSLAPAFAVGLALLGPARASAQEPRPATPPERAAAVVPPYAVATEAPQLRSPALAVAGIVTGGAGLISTIAGLVLINTAPSWTCPAAQDPESPCIDPGSRHTVGMGLLLAGAPVLGIGLTMAILGARPAEQKAAQARGLPAIAIGPTGGSLTWRF